MKHILFVKKAAIASALILGMAAPSFADKIPLDEVSSYLNAMETVKGDFTQINSDGTISTGTLYIRRPGRARFQYNPPEKSVVIAGGSQIAIFDGKSNQPPEQYPLKRTPLYLILKKNVDLKTAKMVVAHTADDNSTTIVAQDPEHPDYGQIRLIFTDKPVELRQWVIIDAGGSETTVILGALEKGIKLHSKLFDPVLEAHNRGLD